MSSLCFNVIAIKLNVCEMCILEVINLNWTFFLYKTVYKTVQSVYQTIKSCIFYIAFCIIIFDYSKPFCNDCSYSKFNLILVALVKVYFCKLK